MQINIGSHLGNAGSNITIHEIVRKIRAERFSMPLVPIELTPEECKVLASIIENDVWMAHVVFASYSDKWTIYTETEKIPLRRFRFVFKDGSQEEVQAKDCILAFSTLTIKFPNAKRELKHWSELDKDGNVIEGDSPSWSTLTGYNEVMDDMRFGVADVLAILVERSNKLMIKQGIDGIDHINIYSKGATELGRKLSNFARIGVTLPEGGFASIEAYWYYLGIHPKAIVDIGKLVDREDMKHLFGWKAKNVGKQLKEAQAHSPLPEEKFRKKIRYACYQKIEQHPDLKKELIASTLPFAHYYVFNGIIKDAGFDWLVEFWEAARKYYREQDEP